jgi:hypothetical protein
LASQNDFSDVFKSGESGPAMACLQLFDTVSIYLEKMLGKNKDYVPTTLPSRAESIRYFQHSLQEIEDEVCVTEMSGITVFSQFLD